MSGAKKTEPVVEPKKKIVSTKYLILKPRISEKGYAVSENGNTFIFDIPSDANKFDIGSAVAVQYGVKVVGVRVAGVPGKAVRTYRQRGRKFVSGQRTHIRKAYVTLVEGDKLPIFASGEQPNTPKENK